VVRRAQGLVLAANRDRTLQLRPPKQNAPCQHWVLDEHGALINAKWGDMVGGGVPPTCGG